MKTETTSPDISKIQLKNVRLSYPHLFVPQQNKGGGKAKYSADLILDKKIHADTIAKIEKIIERVSLDFFKKAVKLKQSAFHDGNEKEDQEGYGDDVMYIVAKNDRKFPVVDRDPSISLTAEDPKPFGGCYVNAVVRFYAYDHETGGKGVSASLEAVQFVRDGKAFGAGPVDPEDEFTAVAEGEDDI